MNKRDMKRLANKEWFTVEISKGDVDGWGVIFTTDVHSEACRWFDTHPKGIAPLVRIVKHSTLRLFYIK